MVAARLNVGARALSCVAVVTLTAAACGEITQYEVQPTRVCGGEVVAIRWKANTSVTLSGDPPVAGLGARPAEGTASVPLDHSSRLTLVAERLFKTARREWDVVVVPSAPPKPFGGLAACNEGARSLEVAFTLTSDDVSATARPMKVTNPYDRRLVIAKDGAAPIALAPRGATEDLKGVSAQGGWTIRAPIETGETCDGVLASLSDRLVVTLQLSCGG